MIRVESSILVECCAQILQRRSAQSEEAEVWVLNVSMYYGRGAVQDISTLMQFSRGGKWALDIAAVLLMPILPERIEEHKRHY